MKLAICVATMRPRPRGAGAFQVPLQYKVEKLFNMVGPGDIPLATAQASSDPVVYVRYNTAKDNLGVVGSYQALADAVGSDADVLCFMHDDVVMRERAWDLRVLEEFKDERVGLVGFGGAKWHGVPDLYKTPYRLQQLIRGGYLSNVDDAEVHGERFAGSTEAAVLDGFSLCVRRTLLDRIGGWAAILRGCDFFCYDYALCALARRLGYRIRVVGVRCHHRGGGTSVGGEAKSQITSQDAYDSSHRWFYDEFKDVMPWRVK